MYVILCCNAHMHCTLVKGLTQYTPRNFVTLTLLITDISVTTDSADLDPNIPIGISLMRICISTISITIIYFLPVKCIPLAKCLARFTGTSL